MGIKQRLLALQRNTGLPFEVKDDEPNEITCKAMADAENGSDMHGPYNSVKELMEALDG